MNTRLQIRLQTTPEQERQLQALQALFVQACNGLAAQAQASGVWSRIGLHQLAYHTLRSRYPELGAQMACNVIYSVSRAARLLFQHPASPWHGRQRSPAGVPRLRFGPAAPVYFDRHTLNVRDGHASMYSLDGRLRFNLPLAPADEFRLRHGGIREIALHRDAQGLRLDFMFAPAVAGEPAGATAHAQPSDPVLPEYLLLLDASEEAACEQRPQGQAAPSPPSGLQARWPSPGELPSAVDGDSSALGPPRGDQETWGGPAFPGEARQRAGDGGADGAADATDDAAVNTHVAAPAARRAAPARTRSASQRSHRT